jgi:hypothetical protein
MAKAINTFLRSKMNKDLDARLIPNGEYRNAVNVQISKSEGDGVGTVENVLGNTIIFDLQEKTGVSNLYCIGYLSNDTSNTVFLFLTDNTDGIYKPTGVGSNHFIFACNPNAQEPVLLVTGAFLNLSQLNPIYGINLLENLLFWTDNRNQPRKINIDLANPEGNINTATHYTNEDQISVAKYNPYECMELYQESYLSSESGKHESTMKDVSSKFLPNGGRGSVVTAQAAGQTNFVLESVVGDIQKNGSVYSKGSTLGVIDSITGEMQAVAGLEVDNINFSNNQWNIVLSGSGTMPALEVGQEVIFNPNPYYNPNFPGDADYLEDKFVRFSYRFKFEDNEYSVFAPFTQIAFIPKQDGYFMYVQENSLGLKAVDDQANAYRSTVVYFVENKVDDIVLKIPLPFNNFDIQNNLKITEVDILYKEAQDLAVKVVDTIPVSEISNSAGKFTVSSNNSSGATSEFSVSNVKGGIPIGGLVTGFGISGKPKITEFTPTNPSDPSSGGVVKIDLNEALVTSNTILQVNEIDYFNYNYQSKKPFKTLPEKDLTRVYDKTPVKAFAQEVSGNRIIYGNYQDKHTPPEFLNYNVSVSNKSDFNLNKKETSTSGGTQSGTTLNLSTTNAIVPEVGDFLTIISGTGTVPENTQVTEVNAANPSTSIEIFLNKSVTNIAASDLLLFAPAGGVQDTTSIVEYPNSTLKQNRNYQVGIVLSDRYSRTSGVILSNNRSVVKVGTQAFSGSTLYSAYLDESTVMSSWPGNSLKVLFNQTIDSVKNPITGAPGLYNGDPTSENYNPLGWYSWKVVVKQTEQEYYNVYLPGIMAAYPEDTTLEIGKTSHAVLINDNINKVPRDLSEVGPDQRQFRSSVQLFGRVENTSAAITATNLGEGNQPYYPGKESDTVSTISTVSDMFDYSPLLDKVPSPNYFPQFYSVESNPLIARISTESKIGQTATTNYNTVSARIAESSNTDLIELKDISGGDGTTTLGIIPGDSVIGNFSSEIKVASGGFTPSLNIGSPNPILTTASTQDNTLTFASSDLSNKAPGNIVQGIGIPAGTSVVSIDTSSGTITVSNVVNVANATEVTFSSSATLELTESVSVELDDNIIIQPSSIPGIQYLAVYETEPTESLLDIFWETSSSGLISDLNNAVLNDSSGGASLSELNASNFTEAITTGSNIFSAPFKILDNFGSPVSFLDITSPLELVSAFNDLGENVNDSDSIRPVIYFQLVQTGSNINSYNIQVTQTYFNNIYFGENTSNSGADRRNFTLNLRASINELESNFTINLSLRNISPNISSPDNGIQFAKGTTDSTVTSITATNGAANINLASIFSQGSCIISQVLNGDGQDVTQQGYFSVPQEPSIVNNEASWSVINNFSTVGDLIPIDDYTITATVEDAAGGVDADSVTFSVNYGAQVRGVEQRTYRTAYQNFTKQWYYQDITLFEIHGGVDEDKRGYYLYNGAWSEDTRFPNAHPPELFVGGPYGNYNWPGNLPSGAGAGAFYGPATNSPLVGGDTDTSTFAINFQVTVDVTNRNKELPLDRDNLATPESGTRFLLYSPDSKEDVVDLWVNNFMSLPIFRVQFNTSGNNFPEQGGPGRFEEPACGRAGDREGAGACLDGNRCCPDGTTSDVLNINNIDPDLNAYSWNVI